MKKLPILILLSGAIALTLLIVLHRSTGAHVERHPWLHSSILPALALTTLGSAFFAPTKPLPTRRMPPAWALTHIAGGLGFLEGNSATPLLYLFVWPVAVVALQLMVNRYGREPGQQTV